MIFNKSEKANPKKAEKLTAKGDKYCESENFEKALESYREAQKNDPDNPIIYEKLVSTQSKIEGEWSEKEFVESMDWLMKKQEIDNPEIKDIYSSLSPEYQQVKQLIAQMLMTEPELRPPLLQKIKSFKEKAVQPLLDILLSLDALSRGVLTQDPEEDPTQD